MKNASLLHISKEQINSFLIILALIYIIALFYVFEQSPRIATFHFFMLCTLCICILFRYIVRNTMEKIPEDCTLYKILSKIDDKIIKLELFFDISHTNNLTNNESIDITSNSKSKKDNCISNNTEYTFDMFKDTEEVEKEVAAILINVSTYTLDKWRSAGRTDRPTGRKLNGKVQYIISDLKDYHYGKGKYKNN